jgi:hypothetical protein
MENGGTPELAREGNTNYLTPLFFNTSIYFFLMWLENNKIR